MHMYLHATAFWIRNVYIRRLQHCVRVSFVFGFHFIRVYCVTEYTHTLTHTHKHTRTFQREVRSGVGWRERERVCVRPKVLLLTPDIARAVSKLFFTQAALLKQEKERER